MRREDGGKRIQENFSRWRQHTTQLVDVRLSFLRDSVDTLEFIGTRLCIEGSPSDLTRDQHAVN
jgi:hypothetical protein